METIEFFQSIKIPSTVAHVIAVVFAMGGGLMSDVLFSFFSKDKKLNKTEIATLTILKNIVLYALIIVCLSGFLIFLSDTQKYLNSMKFLSKMSILFVLLFNGYVLNTYIWPHVINRNFFTLKKERNIRKLAFTCGAVSVISWLSVCALGVLDKLNMSYVLIMSIYGAIVFVGIIVALLIEKKELN
jgi:hypothetical protein